MTERKCDVLGEMEPADNQEEDKISQIHFRSLRAAANNRDSRGTVTTPQPKSKASLPDQGP